MDAFTDIGWFLYISLDSYKVWMHLQTLVGFCTSLLILTKYGCIYRHWLVSVHLSWFLQSMDAFTDIGWFLYISLDSYKVWMHLQTLVGFCASLLILTKYGCIYRHFTIHCFSEESREDYFILIIKGKIPIRSKTDLYIYYYKKKKSFI